MRTGRWIATLVVALCLVPATAAEAAAPVAHWALDEKTGTDAADSTGNGNTASWASTDGLSWQTGWRLWGLSGSGPGGATVRDNATLEPGTVTVDAWVKRSGSPGSFKYIVAKGATGCEAAAYGLYTSQNGGLAFYVSHGGGLSYARSPEADPAKVWNGAWHHVAGTFDGTAVRVYLDGAEIGSTPHTTPIDHAVVRQELTIGTYGGTCGDLSFTGQIDEPRVWDGALTASGVEAAKAYAFAGFFSPVDNGMTVNALKAGQAVPVKWSMTGDKGLGILSGGSPTSTSIPCGSTMILDAIEETVTAGSSSLSYDAITDSYRYTWKTEKSWGGTCRQLSVRMVDGHVETARFQLTR